VWEQSKQTRLGQGFFATRQLQPEPVAQTAKAVAEFATRAREKRAASIRVIATSAARDAINAESLTAAVERACGLHVQILSGDQEADLAFQGVVTDAELARQPLLLLDVGGGSTEFILGHGEQKDFRRSFALGTVRLLEELKPSDPPHQQDLSACRQWLDKFLRTEVRATFEPAMRREQKFQSEKGGLQLVGTGGTASLLGCMEAELDVFDRVRLEATRLNLQRLQWHVERLWSLPLAERKKLKGLPPNRADVILPGAVIFEMVLQVFGFQELRISTRGLRFAAVMDL
jgi:exopolyphosphatase/guanosine-5'-triphosphate,3'-diphosphate pyrophosphatase